jgi:hypothetical protein
MRRMPSWFGSSWQFGLADFYEFIDETGSEGVITVNYSYARYGIKITVNSQLFTRIY